jgi:uncharacterized phage protein (TIGR01671 family)
MNREIKFRAWHGGEMVFSKPMPDFVFWKWYYDSTTRIMQYVGLKDKNGKEIYEGDIFIPFNSDSIINTVEFKNGAFGYLCKDTAYEFFISFNQNEHFDIENNCSKQIEVIGNIYENPELLTNGD